MNLEEWRYGSPWPTPRIAVVISPKSYNGASGLSIICPITSVRKGYPYEVSVTTAKGINGVALVDQLRCIDW